MVRAETLPNAGFWLTFLSAAPNTDATVGTQVPKTKTDLSRSRTHNEQTLIRPCGVILAHATFWNSEAVSNVLARYFELFICSFC